MHPRLAVALAALALAACECGGGETFTRVVPKIALAEQAIDFGEVPIGATKRVRLSVRNEGTADLLLESVDTSPPFGAQIINGQLQAGANGTVDVSFKPANDQGASGMLLIRSNDPGAPMTVVSLSGLGIAGNVTVRPASIDFFSTVIGTSRSAEIFVQNIGLDAVNGRITTEGFLRPENFALTALSRFDGTAPFAIAARNELGLDLEYRPLMFGDDVGRIVFEVCGERCGVEVDVTGTAIDSTVKLEPPLVDFGIVGIGTTKSDSVLVRNTGSLPLDVLSISVAGGGELVASSVRPFPATIAAGASLTIGLDYTPASAAPFEGELTVRTTDAAVPEARVQVRGQGEGPLFVVQPDRLAFGVTRDMATHRRAFIMLNAGSADVSVRAIRVTGAAFAVGELPGLPARMASGESLTGYVTFSPLALGEYSGTLEVESDDPARGLVTIPLTGGLTDRLCELGQSEPQINFGLMPIGYTRNRSVTLTNVGTDECLLSSGSFRAPIDPAITLTGGGMFPISLSPGQQTSLIFNYTPTDQIESKANYVMVTGDPVFPERHLSLLGSAGGYVDIFVEPPTVDFGQTRINCAVPEQKITVYNAGTISAFIDNYALNVSSSEIDKRTPGTPTPLNAGGTAEMHLSYQPTDLGVDSGDLEIFVRDLPYPLIVPVRGEGSDNPRTIDGFEQMVARKVDVLFVIDDSCSMFDEQAELSQNIRAFVMEAESRSVDFQLGVTTTTLFPVPGKLVGPVLSNNTSNLEQIFAMQANVGTMGSGVEQGLDAMYSALDLAQRGVTPNDMLLRADATLFVVIVSDEDDQSNGTGVVYLNALRNAAPAGFFFSAITGQAMGCGNAMPTMNPGAGAAPCPTYESFVALSGGLSESICADWSMTLSTLGNAAFGLRSRFPLTREADTMRPIDVRIDGQPAPAGDWTYDMTDNAVHFNNPPAEGSTIEIEYTPTC